MFEVYEIHEGDQAYKVYAVKEERGELCFLLFDEYEHEWYWDKASNYAPVRQ